MLKRITQLIVICLTVAVLVVITGCISPTEVTTSSNRNEDLITSKPTTQPGIPTASINEALVVKYRGDTFEITVLDAIRGTRATTLLKQANQFNPDPSPDYEHLLVKVRIKYIEGSGSKSVSSWDYKLFVDGAGFSESFAVLPNSHPSFKSATLLPGGSTEGWIFFNIPVGSNRKLAYVTLFDPVGFIQLP
jgi:hypothetical protein